MGINTTKQQALDTHAEDFAQKLKDENDLSAELIAFYVSIANDYTAVYKATGKVLNLGESYEQELYSLLVKNYRNTASNFSTNIRSEIPIPKDVETNTEQKDQLDNAIAMAIGAYVLLRARAITPEITKTAQKQLQDKTNSFIVDKAIAGEPVNNAQIADSVGEQFAEWGTNHAPTVSTTEVQNIAETVKNIEATQVDSYLIGKTTETIKKRWITAGDEKVRASHVDVDFVVKNVTEPFIVGGYMMQYSGDMENGAPLKEVINCRCSTIYMLNNEIIKVIQNTIFRKGKQKA